MRLKCLLAALLLPFISYAMPDTLTYQVQVKGLVEHSFTINLENIGQLRAETHKDYKITGPAGDVRKVFKSFTGVRLKSLLDSAGIIMPKQKDRGKYYITVTASDGYTVMYSWNEIYNNSTGDHVFLIWMIDEQPIMQDGRFVMICDADKVTGPRHVKWVSSIEVARLP